MTTSEHHGSATIHAFPAASRITPRRFGERNGTVVAFVAKKPNFPAISTDAWYHEAALLDDARDH